MWHSSALTLSSAEASGRSARDKCTLTTVLCRPSVIRSATRGLQASDAVGTPARDCDFRSSVLIKQRHLEPPGNCQGLRGTRMVKTDVVPATLESYFQ